MSREGVFLALLIGFSLLSAVFACGFIADALSWAFGVVKWKFLVGSVIGMVLTFFAGLAFLRD